MRLRDRPEVLYVGDLWPGGTCFHRMEALSELCMSLTCVNSVRTVSTLTRIAVRVGNRLRVHIDTAGVNEALKSRLNKAHYDLVWIDKGQMLKPSTLDYLRSSNARCLWVSYSPDDMFNPRNASLRYRACIPLYDLHVTTKSYNVKELYAAGANDVLFIGNAYHPPVHHPIDLSAEEQRKWQSDISFIGGYERDESRYRFMWALAEAGQHVVIRGPEWERCNKRHPNIVIEPGWVYGEDYARAISGAKINLCFLRRVNRDLQTTRSVEIPACGGFMLAERTSEHTALFREGVEAEFFSTQEELITKASKYLRNDEQRVAVGCAGLSRCISSGYSNRNRLQTVLDYLERISCQT